VEDTANVNRDGADGEEDRESRAWGEARQLCSNHCRGSRQSQGESRSSFVSGSQHSSD